MTVHKAKGLEFPVVILADIGCKLHRADAQRHLDTETRSGGRDAFRMDAARSGGAQRLETSRDRAEAVRLAYVAATRARRYTGRAGHRRCARTARLGEPAVACDLSGRRERARLDPAGERLRRAPAFAGRDTVLERPIGQSAGSHDRSSGCLRHDGSHAPAKRSRSSGGTRCCWIARARSGVASGAKI